MAASPFERQVVEGDATDDRSPSNQNMADGPQQFPPTPSFLDHDRPTVRLVELPAWLQSFASSVGEPSESESAAAPESEPSEEAVSSSNDPAKPQARAHARSSGRSASKSADVGTDFISEDDLPEWLRSIAPSDSGESTFEALPFDPADDGEQISVPTISRAWSTSKDARGVDETTSLFALVASQAPQTALPNQAADSQGRASAQRSAPSGADKVAGYGSDRPPGEPESVEIALPARMDTVSAEPEKGSFPILPIVVAAILVLILVAAAAIMFL